MTWLGEGLVKHKEIFRCFKKKEIFCSKSWDAGDKSEGLRGFKIPFYKVCSVCSGQ